jgi:hypothetical protein
VLISAEIDPGFSSKTTQGSGRYGLLLWTGEGQEMGQPPAEIYAPAGSGLNENQKHGFQGQRRLSQLGQLIKVAPRVCPAAGT